RLKNKQGIRVAHVEVVVVEGKKIPNKSSRATPYYEGNPSEDELPVPVIESHIKQFGKAPQAVATDHKFSTLVS
ncbi:hypothetical protein JDS79_31585, partial [Bacillus cereus]|nr:hypothetical protein [Bacillus cereus]